MKTLITNIGQLVTPRGSSALAGRSMSDLCVLGETRLLVANGRIASIGTFRSEETPDQIIDAEGGVVLPGLIDPHRHLPALRGPVGEGAGPSPIERTLRRAAAMGTVGMEIKSSDAEGDVISAIDRARQAAESTPLRVWHTLLGWMENGHSIDRSERISALIGEVIPRAKRRRTAAFCDAACGGAGFSSREAEAILRAGLGAGFRTKVHALPGGAAEAASVAASLGAMSVDHVDEVPYRAMKALRKQSVVGVVLPARSLIDSTVCPPARELIDQDLPVALGTDFGAYADGVESLWVIIALATRRLGISLAEAICAVTLNAAAALGSAEDSGSVEVGKRADLVILDMDDYRDIPRCVGANPVRSTLIGGEQVAG